MEQIDISRRKYLLPVHLQQELVHFGFTDLTESTKYKWLYGILPNNWTLFHRYWFEDIVHYFYADDESIIRVHAIEGSVFTMLGTFGSIYTKAEGIKLTNYLKSMLKESGVLPIDYTNLVSMK